MSDALEQHVPGWRQMSRIEFRQALRGVHPASARRACAAAWFPVAASADSSPSPAEVATTPPRPRRKVKET